MRDEIPCRYCEHRSPTCHASCELYAKWRTLHLTEKEKERKTRELERMIAEREQAAVKKMIHHRNRKQ